MSVTVLDEVDARCITALTENLVIQPNPEFLNALIAKVWPTLEEYFEKLVVQKVTKLVAERIDGLLFQNLKLGNEPPILSNLKLYKGQNIEVDEVVIDADVVYKGSMVVNAMWKTINFGIRNVQVSGKIRFRFAPLSSSPPFCGAISITMLCAPVVDFEATGFANFVYFKPIYQSLRSFISEKLLDVIVVPNAVVVPLNRAQLNNEDVAVSEFRCRVPRGVLQVLAVEASELASHDTFSESDPYVRVRMGAEEKRSRTIDDTSAPVWREALEFDVRESAGAILYIDVFDEDPCSTDDLIGCCATFDFRDAIARVRNNSTSVLRIIGTASASTANQTSDDTTRYDTKWYQLRDTKGGFGRVRLGFRYFDFVEKPQLLGPDTQPVNTVVCVYVHSASLLCDANVTTRVNVSLRSSDTNLTGIVTDFNTVFCQDSNEPKWGAFFKWLLPSALQSADCDKSKHVVFFSVRSSTGNLLGETSVPLADVLRSHRLRIANRLCKLTTRGMEESQSNPSVLRVTVAVRYVAAYRNVDFSKLDCAPTNDVPIVPAPNPMANYRVNEKRTSRVRVSFMLDEVSRIANVTIFNCVNLVPLEGALIVRSRVVVRFLPSGRQKFWSRAVTGVDPQFNQIFTFLLESEELSYGYFCITVRHTSYSISLRQFFTTVHDLLGEMRHISLREIREAMLNGTPMLTDWFDLIPVECDNRSI